MQNLKCSKLKKIVLIGASTGGPGQIQKIIDALPVLQNTSVVIAQHMAVDFMQSFALRIQKSTQNAISIPEDKQRFESGMIYISQGETEIEIKSAELLFKQHKAVLHSFNPNINLLFGSFHSCVGELEILCVILTGIGSDGVDACRCLSQSKVRCLTESHKSAIVDGMPARARDSIANIEVDEIDNIIKKISEFCE